MPPQIVKYLNLSREIVDTLPNLPPLESMIREYFSKLTDYKPIKSLQSRQERVLRYFLEVNEATSSIAWKKLKLTDRDFTYKYANKIVTKLVDYNFLEKTNTVDERNKGYSFYRLTEMGLLYIFSHSNYITQSLPMVDISSVFTSHSRSEFFRITLLILFEEETIEKLTLSLRMLLLAYVHDIANTLEKGLLQFKRHSDDSQEQSTFLTHISMILLWRNISFLLAYVAIFERYHENISLLANDEKYLGIAKAAQKNFSKFVEALEYQRRRHQRRE